MSYQNYDLQENDPYLISGSTCLINSLGIHDTQLLNKAEQEISAAAYAGLIARPAAPSFDSKHLQAIHFRLLGDVYPWAGQFRNTEIAKGSKLFLPYRLIARALDELFMELHAERLLKNSSAHQFAERAAYYLGRINAVHPFREGNGRAQRIFLDQLAEVSGFGFCWSAISGEQMASACRQARMDSPDVRPLKQLLKLHIMEL